MNEYENKGWWYPIPIMVALGVLLFYAGVLERFGFSTTEIQINQFSDIILFSTLSLGITGFLYTEYTEHKANTLLHKLLLVSVTITSAIGSYITTVCANLLTWNYPSLTL
jgi:hypothetical protein